MGTRRTYIREFGVGAVWLLDTSGKSGHEIEQDVGIGTRGVYRWRKQLEQEEGTCDQNLSRSCDALTVGSRWR